MKKLVLLPLLFAAFANAAAQHHGHHGAQPASETSHAIKALSAADIEGYREGRGMGLARAAERNGYPGPLHVLELADSLGLTLEQRAATESIRQAMLDEARPLGISLVEQEQALDRLFANGQATPDAVDALTAQIAETHGRLRAAHLRAHVAQRAVLTPEQTAAYNRLRGHSTD